MEPFKTYRGILALLDSANVDTDQIIAKQFLKLIGRTGFGQHLFHDWRYQEDGTLNPDFSLNRPEYLNASILVTRNNFGCGSSREHAVWAVQQYGFKTVIAPRKKTPDGTIPGFADIFRNNSAKNGLLTVELSEEEVEEIFQTARRLGKTEATVDLGLQKIILHAEKEREFAFEMDPAVKHRLAQGLDDIAVTLRESAVITAFEASHNTQIEK
jgi:3-isopropylmalate/(R)-2-methylmalate dehydratase small subunit